MDIHKLKFTNMCYHGLIILDIYPVKQNESNLKSWLFIMLSFMGLSAQSMGCHVESNYVLAIIFSLVYVPSVYDDEIIFRLWQEV